MIGLAASLMASSAYTADPVKIGFITSLSTGAGYLGQDIYDAFMLAVEEEGGKLGGVPVNVLVEDDQRKADVGKQLAKRFIKRDGVDILTGIVFSNVAAAVVPSVLREGKIYVSPNAAPGIFAGKGCSPNYFVASWQNNTLHESAGFMANNKGYKTAYVMAPNYLAGKDAIAGFKTVFKGKIVGESLTKLGATDYASELAKIRAANPEVIFQFLPGGMGMAWQKQYAQSKITIPQVFSASSLDARMASALGDIILGLETSSHWSPDLDNMANKKFMDGFLAKYDRVPTMYAAQGYDTAKWIASALKATGGDTDADKISAALKQLNYASVRGDYKLANNNHPIQNWYSRKIVKTDDGKYISKMTAQIATSVGDRFAAQCALK